MRSDGVRGAGGSVSMIGETVQLPIDQIRTNGGTQPRSCSNADVVADYSIAMEAGDQFPPVVVFYDGTNY